MRRRPSPRRQRPVRGCCSNSGNSGPEKCKAISRRGESRRCSGLEGPLLASSCPAPQLLFEVRLHARDCDPRRKTWRACAFPSRCSGCSAHPAMAGSRVLLAWLREWTSPDLGTHCSSTPRSQCRAPFICFDPSEGPPLLGPRRLRVGYRSRRAASGLRAAAAEARRTAFGGHFSAVAAAGHVNYHHLPRARPNQRARMSLADRQRTWSWTSPPRGELSCSCGGSAAAGPAVARRRSRRCGWWAPGTRTGRW